MPQPVPRERQYEKAGDAKHAQHANSGQRQIIHFESDFWPVVNAGHTVGWVVPTSRLQNNRETIGGQCPPYIFVSKELMDDFSLPPVVVGRRGIGSDRRFVNVHAKAGTIRDLDQTVFDRGLAGHP